MKYVIGGVVLIMAGLFLSYWAHKKGEEEQRHYEDDKWVLTRMEDALEIAKKIDKSSEEDLMKLKVTISVLPAEDQEDLMPYVDLRLTILTFQEAEKLLEEAASMHRTLGEDGDELHPMVNRLLTRAIKKYEESKRIVDNLGEMEDEDDYNFTLNYVKGEVYFRHLQLLRTPETANALFKSTVNYFKFALRYRPRDTNTVVNIELLIKKQNQFASANPKLQKRQLLNSKAGLGSSKGN